jgi:uncharacterized protein YdhG (YjbR/CyaY superfamily)
MQIMTTMKFKSIDEYLESVTDDKRTALERLRKIIGAAVPGVEECISYNMPAFSLDGKAFIWFGAGANHCALYGVHETRKGEFSEYDADASGKGTLRFQSARPLPAAFVRKLVQARFVKLARTSRAKDQSRGLTRP